MLLVISYKNWSLERALTRRKEITTPSKYLKGVTVPLVIESHLNIPPPINKTLNKLRGFAPDTLIFSPIFIQIRLCF